MNWKRALPALVFTLLAFGLYAVNTPPSPPTPKRPHTSSAVHQGAGAAALVKPMMTTRPTTNAIVWQYPVGLNPSNAWWNIELSTDLKNWSVLISNASGEATVNVKKSQPLQVYRLSGRFAP